MEHPDISRALLDLKAKDLTLRDDLILRGVLYEGYHPEMAALHQENAAALGLIIRSIGYPTVDKVGEAGSAAAWLVIQHAIGAPEFMKECARQLAEAVQDGKANPVHLAYLTDRIAIFENRPQRYGTQFDWDIQGQMSPQPFDDLGLVNERRASLGLNTLEAQTAILRKQVATEGSPPADTKARKRAYDLWRREVGWI